MITLKVIEWQKSLLEKWKFCRPFLNTVTACEKYSVISRDKSMQTSQMHLSQKQIIFSNFISAFFESALNFEHFQKKMTLRADVFLNYRPRKTCLDKCLKTPVSEDPSTGDMVNGPNHWFNINQGGFIILSNLSESNWVANVTPRHMKILQTFS